MSIEEREEISRRVALGHSCRAIATRLGRAPSTITREIARNGGRKAYRAVRADEAAWGRARRFKTTLLAREPELCEFVAKRIDDDWSPEQIAGHLRHHATRLGLPSISHETIYRSVFIRTRAELDHSLTKHLRTRRAVRRGKRATSHGKVRGGIIDATPLSQRPPEIETRQVPGHWEGDLVLGSNQTAVATLVERTSRFCVIVPVADKQALTITDALTARIAATTPHPWASITFDRGPEFAAHKKLTAASGVKIYFAEPRSPWQRGTNENTNGLLRQYFPKGTPIPTDPEYLDQIAQRLNTRPRKTLGYRTPADILSQSMLR